MQQGSRPGVPEPRLATEAGGERDPAVGTEGSEPDDALVSQRRANRPSGGYIPEPGRVIGAGCQHGLAIRAEGRALDLAGVGENGLQARKFALPGGQVRPGDDGQRGIAGVDRGPQGSVQPVQAGTNLAPLASGEAKLEGSPLPDDGSIQIASCRGLRRTAPKAPTRPGARRPSRRKRRPAAGYACTSARPARKCSPAGP